MISFSRASPIEAEQADIQPGWIILGMSDKGAGLNRSVEALLWNQSTVYSLLCRLTGQRWEGEVLKYVSTKPMGHHIGIFHQLREGACKPFPKTSDS